MQDQLNNKHAEINEHSGNIKFNTIWNIVLSINQGIATFNVKGLCLAIPPRRQMIKAP